MSKKSELFKSIKYKKVSSGKKGSQLYKELDNNSTVKIKSEEQFNEVPKQLIKESEFAKSLFKVLIIDDDFSTRTKLINNIKKTFPSITLAESNKEALEKIDKNNFNIILARYRLKCGDNGSDIFFNLDKEITFILTHGFTEFEAKNLKKAGIITLQPLANPKKVLELVKIVYNKFILDNMDGKLCYDY